jgi:hypothetical protein
MSALLGLSRIKFEVRNKSVFRVEQRKRSTINSEKSRKGKPWFERPSLAALNLSGARFFEGNHRFHPFTALSAVLISEKCPTKTFLVAKVRPSISVSAWNLL